MAESLTITPGADREAVYRELLPQIEALLAGEIDVTANLANAAAAIKHALGFFWVGFYLAKQGELVLGPFQGPIACTRIPFNKGVCGHAYSLGETIVVPDVDAFPGHIACASDSISEIVVPIFGRDGSVIGVLDVDSDKPDDFSQIDIDGMTRIVKVVERAI